MSLARAQAGSAGGSALLLRLFESSFFNVHLAVGYLKTYPQSIGITHYLVRRLRQFDRDDVEFYWPQLCYLVITRTTKSVALENFILDRCQEDAHIAVITLWYLQSSLTDLSNPVALKLHPEQFATCSRILNRVQAIIFTDPPFPSSSTDNQPSFLDAVLRRSKEKVNAPVASVVGMSLMAAGVGLPKLVESEGQVVLDQGRSGEYAPKGGAGGAGVGGGDEDDDSGSEDDLATKATPTKPSPATRKPSAQLLGKGAKSLKPPPKRTQTSPVMPNYVPGAPLQPEGKGAFEAFKAAPLKFSLDSSRPAPMSVPSTPKSNQNGSPNPNWSNGSPKIGSLDAGSPFGSSTKASRKKGLPSSHTTPSLSVPSLPYTSASAPYLPNASPNSSSTNLSGSTLPGYGLPPSFLSHLLLLQACREQLDLLRSLQDISTRLVLVPKPARLSSLRAELTVLNHGLPRGCSLGMESRPSTGASKPKSPAETGKPPPHARIVRISPSESVVLNSADRAPFVIHVEVLEGDLDFDPTRRQNAEDLRRALREREAGYVKDKLVNGSNGDRLQPPSTEMGRSASASSHHSLGGSREQSPGAGLGLAAAEGDIGLPTGAFTGPPTPHLVTEEPEREMDLVEQLYGGGAIRDQPIEVPDAEGEPIHNKTVDEQAWHSKEANINSAHSLAQPTPVRPSIDSTSPTTATSPAGAKQSTRPPISLDDYAERMRMAAIMLAQLEASQAASMGVVATGTAVAGAVVGLPGATVAGLGGVVGAGLGAVASRLPFSKSNGPTPATVGQGSTGLSAPLDTASAAAGTSAVSGAPALNTRDSTSSLSASTSASLAAPPSAPAPAAPRQRVLAPADAAAIRERIMSEMMALEEERMERMREAGKQRERKGLPYSAGSTGGEVDGAVVARAVNKDDPSGAVFRESFAHKTERIRKASPYGHLANWNVISVIVKTGADLRQEQLAIQLVKEFGRIWHEEKCPSWVCYFRILVTSETSGLIETITDAVSVHSLKKDAFARMANTPTPLTSFTLYDHFLETFGTAQSDGTFTPTGTKWAKAQENFIQSLASYSVICYLLQLKDRHNGNILVDKDGHLIHIDFGFLLSNSPGGMGFEMAPFKLAQEYIDILAAGTAPPTVRTANGTPAPVDPNLNSQFTSPGFLRFVALFKQNFRVARKHAERILALVELMQKDSRLPCFELGERSVQLLRDRFVLNLPEGKADEFAEGLVRASAGSNFTRLYDLFQGYSNGIL